MTNTSFHLKIPNVFILINRHLSKRICISVAIAQIIHLILFFTIFGYLSIEENGLFSNFLVLAVVTLLIWSVLIGFLTINHLLLRHLIVVLLPYLWCLTEAANNGSFPKVYFCSIVYHLFTYAPILVALDFAIPQISFKGCRKICLWIWNLGILLQYLFIVIILLNKLIYGVGINRDAVIAICQTDYREACDYFCGLDHWAGILLLLGILVIMAFIGIFYRIKLFGKVAKPSRHILVVMLVFFACSLLYRSVLDKITRGRIYKLHTELLLTTPFSYRQELKRYNDFRQTRLKQINQQLAFEHSQNVPNGRYVLIIGESANPHYMSLYGHKSPTTPFQDGLKNHEGFFFFHRAYACYAQTIRVISMLMTDWNQYTNLDKKTLINSVSLLEIAGTCGFHTYWYSNQAAVGANDSPIIAVANGADKTFFLSSQRRKLKRKTYDLELIPFLPKAEYDKELIIIHLAGSHLPYRNCIPRGYGADSSLSCYELSMRYTDEVLCRIFKHFAANNADVIMYISDHSDAVASGKGHDPRPEIFSQEMVEIPMWIWLSEEYRKRNPETATKLHRAANERVFTNDLTFDLILALMGINNRFTVPSLNILDDSYMINSQTARTGYGKIKLIIHPNGNCK